MQILGIHLDKTRYVDFFAKITKLTEQTIVFTPNPEILLKSSTDKEFHSLLSQAHIRIPDGIGLYLAAQIIDEKSKLLSVIKLPLYIYNILFNRQALFHRYGDKICGSDLTNDLIHYAESESIQITILDPYFPKDLAKCESQKHFKKNMHELFPKLDFDFYIYKEQEKTDIIHKISQSKSKILFSTLGMKKQEQSVIEIMKQCANIKLGLGVGSSFDYFTGFQKRAPEFLRNFGLEWGYRIFTSPQKTITLKRVFTAIVTFTYTIYKHKK